MPGLFGRYITRGQGCLCPGCVRLLCSCVPALLRTAWLAAVGKAELGAGLAEVFLSSSGQQSSAGFVCWVPLSHAPGERGRWQGPGNSCQPPRTIPTASALGTGRCAGRGRGTRAGAQPGERAAEPQGAPAPLLAADAAAAAAPPWLSARSGGPCIDQPAAARRTHGQTSRGRADGASPLNRREDE